MASQVFYRKWRPQTLAEVVGQEQVTQTLRNALGSSHISHAYLFSGPRGTGKTSTGRILAKAVNCLNNGQGEPCNACTSCQEINEGRALDVIEIDAASNRGIDEIRELRERVNYAPSQARYKVYIIDEVHMLTKEAANALLKTLEEPPPHAIFVLATTEAHKVLATILSRCQHFTFRRISHKDIAARLAEICQAEGITAEPEALQLIARSATGSLRDATNLLEQLTTYYGNQIELLQVQNVLGITGDWRVKELVIHIVNNDVTAGINTINNINNDGLDLRQFNRELVAYLRGLLLVKTGSGESVDLTTEDRAEMEALAAQVPLSQILQAVKLFGQLDLTLDNYSTLPLELALVDCSLSSAPAAKADTTAVEHEAAPPPRAKQPAAKAETPLEPTEATPPAPAKQPVPKAKTPLEPTEATPPAPAKEPTPEAEAPPVTPATHEPASVAAESDPPQNIVLEGADELERLRLNWRLVIEQAPGETKRTPAIAILRSAGVKPVAIEDDTVVLSFKYNVHKEKMEKMENQLVVQGIISNFLGHSCRVRCVYQPENNHLVKAAMRMGAQVTSVEEKNE